MTNLVPRRFDLLRRFVRNGEPVHNRPLGLASRHEPARLSWSLGTRLTYGYVYEAKRSRARRRFIPNILQLAISQSSRGLDLVACLEGQKINNMPYMASRKFSYIHKVICADIICAEMQQL
jgi:hypothetical protein